jgi:TATA-binding protein-associated factor
VFALDRFGDYVSDQVVAPVRETCAQALGIVLSYMSSELVIRAFDVLLHLLQQQKWEIRHGGLLGLKYTIAVRKDLVATLLPRALPSIIQGYIGASNRCFAYQPLVSQQTQQPK